MSCFLCQNALGELFSAPDTVLLAVFLVIQRALRVIQRTLQVIQRALRVIQRICLRVVSF